jgi:hypothetical protein
VQVYSPAARKLSPNSNLLNVTLDSFTVKDVDTQRAGAALFSAVSRKMFPKDGIFESIWTSQRANVTLEVKNAKAYEILGAIVARDGSSVWLVRHRSDALGEMTDLWHIYDLDPTTLESAALEDAHRLFP